MLNILLIKVYERYFVLFKFFKCVIIILWSVQTITFLWVIINVIYRTQALDIAVKASIFFCIKFK